MKIANLFKGVLLGLSLLLATSGFAAKNAPSKGSMLLLSTVTVGGTRLAPGSYSLKWEGSASNLQLSIFQSGKVVATTPARLVDLSSSASSDSAVLKDTDNGSKSLSEVRFGGKKYALEVGEGSIADAGAGSTK